MNMQVFITDRILLSNSSEVTMEARAGGASIPLQLDPPLFALSNSHKQDLLPRKIKTFYFQDFYFFNFKFILILIKR